MRCIFRIYLNVNRLTTLVVQMAGFELGQSNMEQEPEQHGFTIMDFVFRKQENDQSQGDFIKNKVTKHP